MNYIQKNSRQYWRGISSLFLGSFITFALLYCTQPLIGAFSAEFGVTPAYASFSVSLTTAMLAIFMVIMSYLSDTNGRKIIMTAALAGSAALALAIGFTGSFPLLLALRALQGVMLAGFPAIAMAYINEEFEPADAGLVMGIYVSGTSIGGLLGRIIVSTLTDLYSWHTALAATGVLCLLISLWFWLSLPASRNFTPNRVAWQEILSSLTQTLRHPVLRALYSTGFIFMGAFVTLYNYIGYTLMSPPYSLSQTAAGCIFFVYLIGTFSSTFMGKQADRYGTGKILFISLLIMLTGALLTLPQPLPVKVLGLAILTFGFFGSHSVTSSWVGKSAPASKAQASSLYLLFYYLGGSVLGSLGGKFLSWLGWPGVVLLVSLALLPGCLLALWLLKNTD